MEWIKLIFNFPQVETHYWENCNWIFFNILIKNIEIKNTLIKSPTLIAEVIHQQHLLQKLWGRAVDDRVDGPHERAEAL